MRLLICAGGTGGGVYPALSVLQALGNKAPDTLWVGGENGMEAELVKRASVPYSAIPAAGVHGVGLRSLPGNLLALSRGTLAAGQILRQFKPDVLFFTGGYVAAPMAVAGWKIPSLLYVPDIEPGMALKFLSRFAHRIALTTETSRQYFGSGVKCTVTGYPLRAGLNQFSREEACRQLGLDAQRPVLLVSGGSKGARSINRALSAILPDLLPLTQVLHLTGQLDWDEMTAVRAALPAGLQSQYHAQPYLHEMGLALAAADLAVTRAGASTLGEMPLFGLPVILVPYPYAWRYQKVNAAYLVEQNAALLLEDEKLAESLWPTLRSLLADPERLLPMRAAMRKLARPNAAQHIANLIFELAGDLTRLGSEEGAAH